MTYYKVYQQGDGAELLDNSLEALAGAELPVVPHIVVGLHFGSGYLLADSLPPPIDTNTAASNWRAGLSIIIMPGQKDSPTTSGGPPSAMVCQRMSWNTSSTLASPSVPAAARAVTARWPAIAPMPILGPDRAYETILSSPKRRMCVIFACNWDCHCKFTLEAAWPFSQPADLGRERAGILSWLRRTPCRIECDGTRPCWLFLQRGLFFDAEALEE